jgi:hypothetical protein
MYRQMILQALLLALTGTSVVYASQCCDHASQFREGEGYADTPATCENLSYWATRAPNVDMRISMHVRGTLSGVHTDVTLAYHEVCTSGSLRVVCVTYQINGMKVGDVVSFGGGFANSNDQWVKLDPCLARMSATGRKLNWPNPVY